MKLDLGCGKNKKEGYVGIDIFDWSNIYPEFEFMCGRVPQVLSRFENDSIKEVYASHFIEHIEQNLVIPTFNEIYRILIMGGIFEIKVPPTQSPDGEACRGAFCDPTHRSYWNDLSFRYYDMSWSRELSESYGIKCNFKPLTIEFLNEYNLFVRLQKV